MSFSLSAAIAVLCVWIGLTVSYVIPKAPPSFAILAAVAASYVVASVGAHFGAPSRSAV